MRRHFTRKEKIAMSIVQDVCLDGMEADHIKPFSKGGATDVANARLIEAKVNRRKSNFEFIPRTWQKEFIGKWDRRETGPFLLVAIPAGGKTWAALSVARKWLDAASDRRLVIVVPSKNLREQWRDEAKKFSIHLKTKDFFNYIHGFHGGVVTYNLVSSQSMVFRSLCSKAPTMVIFDEIHHCGETESFGMGIGQGFENAAEHLLLSGTPWKTSGTPIPFIEYNNEGYPKYHFRYDYPQALIDGVVRVLSFSYSSGEIHSDISDEVTKVHENMDDDEEAEAHKKILHPDGDWVKQAIRDAHDKLLEKRRIEPDAAAMAVCMNIEHAKKIAKVIADETNSKPSIIVADEDAANDKVKNFRKATKPWLVSVRQISEGVDIKRLQVLLYLTNWRTDLFFRQLIGRVSRRRYKADEQAHIILPAIPTLIRHADKILEFQTEAIRDINITHPNRGVGERVVAPEDPFSTIHTGEEVVTIGNERYSPEDAKKIEALSNEMGSSMLTAANVVKLYGGYPPNFRNDPREPEKISQEEVNNNLSKKINDRVSFIQRHTEFSHAETHKEYMKEVDDYTKQSQMSEEQLTRKLAYMQDWCCEIERY